MTTVKFTFNNVELESMGIKSVGPLTVSLSCFLAVFPSFYRRYGVNGYLGLAPLLQQYSAHSFPGQIQTMLTSGRFLAMKFDINRNGTSFGAHYGSLKMVSMNNTDVEGYSFVKSAIKVPQNNLGFNLLDNLFTNYFNNSFDIDLSNFFKEIRIQGYKAYFESNSSFDLSRTLLNMTDTGTVVNASKQYIGTNPHVEYYEYLNASFLNQLCPFRNDYSHRLCDCKGNNFQGMPLITLATSDLEY